MPDPVKIIQILKAIDAPYRPIDVGIEDSLVKDSLILAKEVRVRYGLLQLLWDLGYLDAYSQDLWIFIKELNNYDKKGFDRD